ncbi:MAG: preprotein translocase subunit SecG [Robiginitomaculum sp.]|nr:MAG: preprotein translocase subunit SecG [Robiginitomaculum sp.]
MANVLLVILLIISIILIGLILIQRSEGGALGIGGSGGGGGLMSGRGTADLVSRMTAIFGAAFLLVSLLISISFNYQNQDSGPFNAGSAQEEMATEAVVGENSQNNDLNAPAVSDKDTTPLVGDSQTAESATNPQEQSEEKTEETPQD